MSQYLSRIEGPPPKRNVAGSTPVWDARKSAVSLYFLRVYSFFVANTLYKLLSKLVAFYLYRNSIFLRTVLVVWLAKTFLFLMKNRRFSLILLTLFEISHLIDFEVFASRVALSSLATGILEAPATSYRCH